MSGEAGRRIAHFQRRLLHVPGVLETKPDVAPKTLSIQTYLRAFNPRPVRIRLEERLDWGETKADVWMEEPENAGAARMNPDRDMLRWLGFARFGTSWAVSVQYRTASLIDPRGSGHTLRRNATERGCHELFGIYPANMG